MWLVMSTEWWCYYIYNITSLAESTKFRCNTLQYLHLIIYINLNFFYNTYIYVCLDWISSLKLNKNSDVIYNPKCIKLNAKKLSFQKNLKYMMDMYDINKLKQIGGNKMHLYIKKTQDYYIFIVSYFVHKLYYYIMHICIFK